MACRIPVILVSVCTISGIGMLGAALLSMDEPPPPITHPANTTPIAVLPVTMTPVTVTPLAFVPVGTPEWTYTANPCTGLLGAARCPTMIRDGHMGM